MKLHFIPYLLGLFFLTSFSVAAQEKAPIMFWNVENYFDTSDNPNTADDDFTPQGKKHWTRTRFEDKRNMIAKTITGVRDIYGEYPSIIGLAEVENAYVLYQLVDNTQLSKIGYNIVHINSRDPRGIETALLYRKEIFTGITFRKIEINDSDTLKRLRHILYVKGLYLFPDGKKDTLHIFVNHWPSKLGNKKKSEQRRITAAQTLSAAVDSIYLSAINTPQKNIPRIILMGDFNDTPGSIPVDLLTSSQAPMINLSTDLKKGSHHYKDHWEKIDQFIVSPPFRNREMIIFDPLWLRYHYKNTFKPIPWRTYSGPRYIGGASDHYPILMILR